MRLQVSNPSGFSIIKLSSVSSPKIPQKIQNSFKSMVSIQNIQLNTPTGQKRPIPAVLAIAGSDSSGGAGIEADLKTFLAHKVYGLTCITALTAQNTSGVKSILETPKNHLLDILKTNFDDFINGYGPDPFPLKVIKTGMLTLAASEVLADHIDFINEMKIKLVIDPVMISTSGSTLSDSSSIGVCLEKILPGSYLCTPNFFEAMELWRLSGGEKRAIESVDDLVSFTVDLQRRLKCENLLVKGGHIPWGDGRRIPGRDSGNIDPGNFPDLNICQLEAFSKSQNFSGPLKISDILYSSKTGKTTIYTSEFIHSKNSHGTGCTLASSVASNIALGIPLHQAVTLSIHYVHKGMVSVGNLGHGNGPLNHGVEVDLSVRDFVKGQPGAGDLIQIHGNLFNYFKTHVTIRDSWARYTKHDFVRLLASNQLPFEDFLYFLKQDFYYLVNYAKIHGLAASVAPTPEQIDAQSRIIANIMSEIEKHKQKLLKVYDVDYENADLDLELQPAAPCVAYCKYLLHCGRNEDFLGVKVALAPCLHGYWEAGVFGNLLREQHDGSLGVLESEDQNDAYKAWLEDYSSNWYRDAHKDGIEDLDSIFKSVEVSDQRLLELCKIFKDVTDLEIAFWDHIVERI